MNLNAGLDTIMFFIGKLVVVGFLVAVAVFLVLYLLNLVINTGRLIVVLFNIRHEYGKGTFFELFKVNYQLKIVEDIRYLHDLYPNYNVYGILDNGVPFEVHPERHGHVVCLADGYNTLLRVTDSGEENIEYKSYIPYSRLKIKCFTRLIPKK